MTTCHRPLAYLLIAASLLPAACGADDPALAPAGDASVASREDAARAPVDLRAAEDAVVTDTADLARPEGCPRVAGAADRVRYVAVSHPFAANGGKANEWELLALALDGKLTRPGTRFTMGRGSEGRVVFTPDGAVGLVAQEDGTLGVFRVDAGGGVEVIHAKWKGAGYATSVVMDPAGARAFVLSAQWRNVGGGVYAVRIGCDGKLTDEGLISASKLPYAMAALDDGSGRVLLAARDVLASPAGDDAHLLSWPDPAQAPSLLGGVDAFGDDGAIVTVVALTPDRRHALIGDNSIGAGVPNRVAVVEITAMGLRATQVLTPVVDPAGLVVSPYENAALVASAFGNALLRLTYDPGSARPFAVAGPITYLGARPELPAQLALVGRGALKGRVLVPEVGGVRQVDFQPDGTIVDRGLTRLNARSEDGVGVLGVQP